MPSNTKTGLIPLTIILELCYCVGYCVPTCNGLLVKLWKGDGTEVASQLYRPWGG